MKAALIVMTILGCDDGATQCHYISTVDGAWQTVALCDSESQKRLPAFANANNYPVIVAVCETAGPDMTATALPQPDSTGMPDQTQTLPAPEATAENRPTLPRRALAFLSGAMPDTTRLRAVVSKPVHYIEDSYSWVARRFAR